MSTAATIVSRGQVWLDALAGPVADAPGFPASVRVKDAPCGDRPARYIAVVPDPDSPLPRARAGEVGLREGWALAQAVDQARREDEGGRPRPLIAVVDVPSQAYGRREEAFGIHQALAGAAGAYAQARLAGHPVVALVVGKAMSGAFLAHGYQANRLIALNDAGVLVHAMGREAAARVTLRSVDDLDRLAADVLPMAYDLASYAALGFPSRVLDVADAAAPTAEDRARVAAEVAAAVAAIEAGGVTDALHAEALVRGGEQREATRRVRALMQAQWNG